MKTEWFQKLYNKDNSSLQKDKEDNDFLQISLKLKDILNTINKEKYINIITIVNYYREIKNGIKNNALNTLKEAIKKFDNVDSLILFLGNIRNDNYFKLNRYH